MSKRHVALAEIERRHGHAAEATATPAGLAAALACYDRAASFLASAAPTDDVLCALGLVAMNRGNALSKLASTADHAAALAAYDHAIALLSALPYAHDDRLRNHLGAAWLNRGHALRSAGDHADLAAALQSHRTAVEILTPLPLAACPDYPANLAGAWINLSDALAAADTPDCFTSAFEAAQAALTIVAPLEADAPRFGELSLMARRAALVALAGHLVTAPEETHAPAVAAASDLIDSGLNLARRWHVLHAAAPAPLATRLFRFGAEFYCRHQPQFLAEFLHENLDAASGAPRAWTTSVEWRDIGRAALARARDDLQRPRFLFAGDRDTERVLALDAALADAAAHFR
ncbi:hypothetical protein K0B96_10865 [Horticoccus luteus]|uniref:Tetratricopeptide repeat protein n=1 Tax=Horticoccus luteus TaxID=2862869 RepID=A0A8F9TRT5_9BACT|nr:hypothetical protein [Horticoccus luteus]QYM77821.1 hypothetical protein K0B96_10865 [Horticoccus luteus]